MEIINVKVNYNGEVTINNEFTAEAPLEMTWFPNNDLVIETMYEKVVVNSKEDIVVTMQEADKNLTLIKDANIKLMQNNVAKYLIVNDKFAYRLPSSILDMV